jgi:ribosome-associated translation inhibitor RaiA
MDTTSPAMDRFVSLERQLRSLGAVHYRLETWGSHGELFRFQCLMEVPGKANHNRYFEATASDAFKAIQQVLDQLTHYREKGRSYLGPSKEGRP